MAHIVNYTDARNGLKAVLDRVADDADVTIITRRDGPNAVLMSEEHYDGLMETLYLLQSPRNAERLLEAIDQARAGAAEVHELIDPEHSQRDPKKKKRGIRGKRVGGVPGVGTGRHQDPAADK